MKVEAKITDIKTKHTGGDGREDQPALEITLEVTKVDGKDKAEPTKIRFSELLSNIADMDNAALNSYFEQQIMAYMDTAFKGQKVVDKTTQEWKHTSAFLGKKYTIEV